VSFADTCGPTTTLRPLQATDQKYFDVDQQFKASWKGGTAPTVACVYAIIPAKSLVDRYDAYKRTLPRPNEKRLFHGTRMNCDFYTTKQPCTDSTCPVCNILSAGFQMRFACGGLYGTGLYFAFNSSKSHGYNSGSERTAGTGKKHRCMFLSRVALGNCDIRPSIGGAAISAGCPSILGQHSAQHHELIVAKDEAVVPSYLIVYEV